MSHTEKELKLKYFPVNPIYLKVGEGEKTGYVLLDVDELFSDIERSYRSRLKKIILSMKHKFNKLMLEQSDEYNHAYGEGYYKAITDLQKETQPTQSTEGGEHE